MTHPADRHLSKIDPVMRQLVKRHGPFELIPSHRLHPFESLLRAIAHQQLHGAAAQTILSRFCNLFAPKKFPKPQDLDNISDADLRDVGFSMAKVMAIRDLADKTISGIVPSARAIQNMDNDDIVKRLVQIRGVGQWTVEMMLIFKLARMDVLPAGDFGVRNGFRIAYRKRDMPKPKALLKFGEKWRPYRTAAAWYLWRAADADKAQKKSANSKKLGADGAPRNR